jgi:hypothetical protein
MTQQDISDLKHEEVDWKERRITRKRSKTKKHENVPTVCYPLWGETFELLAKYRSEDPVRVLTSSTGQPLKKEWIRENENVARDDRIFSLYSRYRKKLPPEKHCNGSP